MVISERHEIGITMNFGKYPVIGLDIENKPYDECPNYIVGGKVRVAWDRNDSRYEGMTSRCELVVDDGKYHLNGGACFLTAEFTVADFVNDIENASTPLVHRNQIVAVAHYSKRIGLKYLRMMKVSKCIDPHCITVASLKDLNEEEEKQVLEYITEKKRR